MTKKILRGISVVGLMEHNLFYGMCLFQNSMYKLTTASEWAKAHYGKECVWREESRFELQMTPISRNW